MIIDEGQNKVSAWISAVRLRTLPLALAAIGMGNLLHFGEFGFRWEILVFGMITTTFLQVMSNLANDLGDSIHGADSGHRKGPKRAVQSGAISREEMRTAVGILALASLASGICLLWMAFRDDWHAAIPLFVTGLICIAAAYFYTNGKKPYGYRALGDLAVFVFFGLVAVLGASWLQAKEFSVLEILPAAALGFWSTAVMNLNNMRDVESDSLAGKRTLPIILGPVNARIYHFALVLGGILLLLVFALFKNAVWVLGAFPGCLLMLKTLPQVLKNKDYVSLDLLLKPQALGTFFAVIGMALFKLFFGS